MTECDESKEMRKVCKDCIQEKSWCVSCIRTYGDWNFAYPDNFKPKQISKDTTYEDIKKEEEEDAIFR